MRIQAAVLASLLALAGPTFAQEVQRERYLVLCPASLHDAVKPLLEHRGRDLDVTCIEIDRLEGDRAVAIQHVVKKQAPRYLLLVGDVDVIPTFDVREAATDRPYGDLDGDGLPEVSIGRLPSSDPAAIRRMVERTVGYEAALDAGAWRKRCALVAGEGGFGEVADAMIENLFTRAVAKKIPAGYDVDLTYASATSSYCYPPAQFGQRVVDRLGEGALVMAYVGHGAERSVDDLTVVEDGRRKRYTVLDAEAAPRIDIETGAPIMVAIACWTGRYEGDEPCIGEELMATGRGPVAFFGATRISHPIPNAMLAVALIGELFGGDREPAARLGPALDRARASLVKGDKDPLRTEILALSMAFVQVDELQREMPRHVDMYNLLGDPALRLARPDSLELEAADRASTGQPLVVRGAAPAGAKSVTVTLEVTRDRFARPAAPQETTIERYVRSNDKLIASVVVPVTDGRFEATLSVPADAPPGTCFVKAFAQGEAAECAIGARPLALARGVVPAAEPKPAPTGKVWHSLAR